MRISADYSPFRLAGAALALAGFLGACSTADTGGPGPGPVIVDQAPNSSGNNQLGTAGLPLPSPFCLQVTQDGAPQVGVAANWATPTAGATISPPTSQTNSNGVACSLLTLSQTAGPHTATGAVTGAQGSPVTFVATANPGLAVNMVKQTGDNQAGTVGIPYVEMLTVKVTDQFGNPVQAIGVGWALTAGSATLSANSVDSGVDGVSGISVTPTASGAITITATSVGLNGSPMTFNLTAN